MDKQPKVSVIIPVYNAEKYLRQCLDSVIYQTLGDIEIICVDDGSTDSSLEILREYENDDSRIRVVVQENKNAGAARNHGMKYARGKYLIFLDSDDFFELDMLKDTVELARKYDADVTIFGVWRFDVNTGKEDDLFWLVNKPVMPLVQPFSAAENAEHIFQITSSAPWNKLFKASFIKEHGLRFQEQSNTNDLYFVFSAISEAERICWTDKHYLHYRVGNSSSVQATKGRAPKEFYYALTALRDRLVSRGSYGLFKHSFLDLAEGFFTFNYRIITLEQLDQEERDKLRAGIYDFQDPTPVQTVPDISVIVPVYNSEKYLPACLDSILGQTLRNIEVVCVNDGSSDASLRILSEYEKRDPRIRVINQEQNTGTFMARKVGVMASRSRYLTFVDPDDLLDKRACRTMVQRMDESNADIAQFGVNVRNFTDDPLATSWLPTAFRPGADTLSSAKIMESFFTKRTNITSMVAKAYRSELCRLALGKIEDTYCYVGEDIFTFFFICLYATGYKGFPKDVLYTYNYGLGVGNVDEVSLKKYSAYCDMNRCVQYTRSFLDDHAASPVLDEAYNAMGKRMMEDCCRILTNRIRDTDVQVASLLLREKWSGFWFYESVLTDQLGMSAHDFAEKYIGVPVYTKEAPAYSDGTLPKVSVVIPIYNVEPYLAECLDSIVGQTLREIEIICVNDGSTDNSLRIIERYAERDERIAVISRHNGGLSAARNSGMAEAHGKYLYFIDSDDILAAEALEQLYAQTEKDSLDMILFCADSFFETKELERENSNYLTFYHRPDVDGVLSGEELIKTYLVRNDFRSSVPLQFYNREFLRGTGLRFYEKIVREDELFSSLVLAEAQRLRVCQDRFYKRRVRGSSTMTQDAPGRHFIGSLIVSYNLFIASSKYPEQSCIRQFFIDRGRIMHKIAMQNYTPLSEDERKKAVAALPEEYRQIFAALPGTVTAAAPAAVTTAGADKPQGTEKQFDEAAEIRKSWSYRIGRFITWVPRKTRGGIQCYKEHGYKYTYYRFLEHLHIK